MGDEVFETTESRQRARERMDEGAVTAGYQGNRARVIERLNEALATELVCVLRYRRHYEMARGIHGEVAASEFLEHADEEQDHANRLARRIGQLNGDPNYNPVGLADRSYTQYVEGKNLTEMIQENLIAERIVIEKYGDFIRELGNDDPTTRRLVEDILEEEEEHADDLARMLRAREAPRAA